MKKIMLLLSLIVVGLFLMGCTSVEETQAAGDLTVAEKAQLPPEMKEGETALAGQAVKFENCVDPDSTTTFDKNSLLTKSKTIYQSGSFEDKCYTWNAGTPQEKTRLIEGTCSPTRSGSKFIYWYADCSEGQKCAEGACVNPINAIQLEINTSKLTYAVGEEVEGSYIFNDNGQNFSRLVLVTYSREGASSQFFSPVIGTNIGNYFLKEELHAFKLNLGGGWCDNTPYFLEEGKYTYTLAVYDCLTIEKSLSKECETMETKDFLNMDIIPPLKSTSKTIIVTSGVGFSQCKSNADCKDGKQVCDGCQSVCVDCNIGMECKEGYTCKNNKCVLG